MLIITFEQFQIQILQDNLDFEFSFPFYTYLKNIKKNSISFPEAVLNIQLMTFQVAGYAIYLFELSANLVSHILNKKLLFNLIYVRLKVTTQNSKIKWRLKNSLRSLIFCIKKSRQLLSIHGYNDWDNTNLVTLRNIRWCN